MAYASVENKRASELKRYHALRSDQTERVRLLVKDAKKRSPVAVRLSKAWQRRASKQTSCAVTGIMFDLSLSRRGAVNPLAPSLDRIDSSKGYTDKNTRLVVYFVNVAKHTWFDEQFRLLVLTAASNMRH